MTTVQFLQAQLQAEQEHRSYVVVTILTTEGSTSRTEGKMLVFSDGTTAGTIGGGAMELAAIRDAVYRKPQGHHFESGFSSSRDMQHIGG